MISIHDLYVRSIHSLSEENKVSMYSMGFVLSRAWFENSPFVTALMLVVTNKPSKKEREHGHLVVLRTVLQKLPSILQNGTISWLKIEGEEHPSTLIIHNGVSPEGLSRLARSRWMAIIRQKNLRKETLALLFGGKERALNDLRQAEQKARESTLSDSERVALLLEEANKLPFEQSEWIPVEREARMKARVVMSRPREEVFSYLSDLSHFSVDFHYGTTSSLPRPQSMRATHQVPLGPLQLGTNFLLEYVPSVPSISFNASAEVTEYSPPRSITCTVKERTMFISQIKVTLTPLPHEKTKVTTELRWRRNFFAIFGPFVAFFIRNVSSV